MSYCPRCGEPSENDGDREYADQCWECGWATKARIAADKRNAELFATIKKILR